VPAMLNPMGMEADRWHEMGIDPDFARTQLAAIEAFERMGVQPTLTCTPYLLPSFRVHRGDHLAWAESSAVVFANSVLGAYTNREGGPSALAAAVVGRTARYGYHLSENRLADLIVEIKCPVHNIADFSALGYLVGREAGRCVPYFVGLATWLPPLPEDIQTGGPACDRLKTLGATLAAYGAVALYHIAGYTPEASDLGDRIVRPGARRLVIHDLTEAYRAMDADPGLRHPDLVVIGCPHASLSEIEYIAHRVWGRRLATRLWVTTARYVKGLATEKGLAQAIEEAGGRVVADTCAVVAPVRMLGIRSVATNAGKMACYMPAHSGVRMRFGTLDQCLDAAITGKWPG
ncbi:MAG: aconitase X catalytic domain-containing protein, partial [Anaerolineae bacterium]|nr:aconitase X catalytic domain-containing protein [Anaerolineae bacterium]